MKSFLLVYDSGADLRALRDLVDHHPEIQNWMKNFPNTYFITTTAEADALVKIITPVMDGTEFMVLRVDKDPAKTNGMMGDEGWRFLLKPEEA